MFGAANYTEPFQIPNNVSKSMKSSLKPCGSVEQYCKENKTVGSSTRWLFLGSYLPMIALRPKTKGKRQLKCEAQETQYAALITEDGRAGVGGRREISHGGGEGDGCVVGLGKRLSELGRGNAAHTIFFFLAPFFPPWSALRRTTTKGGAIRPASLGLRVCVVTRRFAGPLWFQVVMPCCSRGSSCTLWSEVWSHTLVVQRGGVLCQVLVRGGRRGRRHPSRHPRVARFVLVVCARREARLACCIPFYVDSVCF